MKKLLIIFLACLASTSLQSMQRSNSKNDKPKNESEQKQSQDSESKKSKTQVMPVLCKKCKGSNLIELNLGSGIRTWTCGYCGQVNNLYSIDDRKLINQHRK